MHPYIEAFASAYKSYGLHRVEGGGVRYREYAPGAKRLCLMGEFNGWQPWEFEGKKDQFGAWEVNIPPSAGLMHGMQVRVVMESGDGKVEFDRIPAWWGSEEVQARPWLVESKRPPPPDFFFKILNREKMVQRCFQLEPPLVS